MDLQPLDLPREDQGWVEFLDARTTTQLAEAREGVETLKALEPGSREILSAWNDIHVSLGHAFAASSLLAQVHPDAGLRDRAEDSGLEAQRFSTDLMLDDQVFTRLSSVAVEGLEPGAARVLADALRGFRRSGIDRDHATREQLRQLSERATERGQAFSRAIREGTRTTLVPVAALADLPDDYRESHPADDDGLVSISTTYPDTHPFLTFSTDADARRAVAATFQSIGWPDNDAVLAELLTVRDEYARLLDYASWPDYDAEVKMIGSGDAIIAFVDRIASEAEASGRRDVGVLLERARRDDPSITTMDVSNSRHYAELVRREQFDVDANAVRRYFDFTRVRAGLLDVTSRLFGLTYTAVEDAPVWHEDVAAYDVDLDGETLGRIYLDLHPREGKYNHAAQFDLVSGVGGRELAEGVLVCNFPTGLMEHSEVVTLFHEFGHLMHHVLAGRHPWVRFSGVATEWDFVEAPSQMLEEWAWDAGVLQSFATDEAGVPIPADLVDRMRAAEEFGKGFYARTQMFYAAISYVFHRELPSDLTARLGELAEQYAAFALLPDTHFHTGFGHLQGYGSGYYTYMWSLVIAKDLFSAFDPDDLFDTDVSHRYRDTVLTPGGSQDAADLVEAFLGRPYDSAAFTRWLED